jgi:hypothetical protein
MARCLPRGQKPLPQFATRGTRRSSKSAKSACQSEIARSICSRTRYKAQGEEPLAEKLVRILSIDGGGIRGIIPARILEVIEERMGKQCSHLFHLIAGTSTGGIIACGLGIGKTAKDMADLYSKEGATIFHRSLWDKVTTIEGLSNPDYDSSPLEAILAKQLGGSMLSDVRDTHLLIPSYAIQLPYDQPGVGVGVMSPRAPYFFKSWRAWDSRIDADGDPKKWNFFLRDVARATSAAPTYFRPALITNEAGDKYGMIDGGVFANNPALSALVSAYKMFPDAEQYMVISLGTGALERPIPYDQAANWGLVHWARPILNVLFDGNADTICYDITQVLGKGHYRFDIALGQNAKQDPNAVNEGLRRCFAGQHQATGR